MFPNIILIGYNYNGVQLYINTHAFKIISNNKNYFRRKYATIINFIVT